jgi:hypothetical protein
MKKAISAATSAALIASLLATAVAPAALAAITVSGVGTIPQGGTSATAATFTFAENTIAALSTTGTFTVTITPAAPGAGTVTFVGTPTVSAPGSLGATASAAGNVLTITITGFDNNNIETLVIGGLKIAASSGASTGAIVATLGGNSAVYSAFVSGTATATGKLSQAYGPTTTNWIVAVDATSPCIFGGTNNVTVGSETLSGVTVSANNVPVAGQQTFTTAAMANNHLANEVVTQSVANCTPTSMASPGTVATVANQDSSVQEQGNNPTTVNPGEQNQAAGTTTLTEKNAGYIPVGTLTFTLSAPGVQFSTSPVVSSGTAQLAAPTGLTATAPSGGSLVAGTYNYEITATTGNGETTVSPSVSITTTSTGSVTLTWTAVAGATGYNVYGRTTFLKMASVAGTTFTDNGSISPSGAIPGSNTATIPGPATFTAAAGSTGTLVAGTYFYKVEAIAPTGANFSTLSAPASITFTSGTHSSVLSWSAVPGATGYNVYGSTSSGGTYYIANSSPIAGLTFTDTTFPQVTVYANTPGVIAVPAVPVASATAGTGTLPGAPTTYSYVVTALDASGETTASNVASATLTSVGSIALSWTAVVGAVSYDVYRLTAPTVYGQLATAVTATTYVDNGSVTPSTTVHPPTTNGTGGATTGATVLGASLCNLSFDRTSCSVSVTTVSTIPSVITLGSLSSPIMLDVASTVPAGTAVNVTVTSSPAILVNVLSNTIAYVARVAVGVATQPVIYINYNDQPTGLISITEAGPGFFVGGTSSDNTFGLCLATGESFTRAPYAVVTKGDLSIRNGLVGASSVLGTLYSDGSHSCVYWTVWTASTVASTIEIRGSDSTGAVLPTGATNGPRLSVPASLHPGTTQGVILIGTYANVQAGILVSLSGVVNAAAPSAFSSLVSMATRAFKNSVIVAAVSQPFIPAGTVDSLAGNLTISETLNGQFKSGQFICVTILPRTSNGVRTQDTFIKTATTNDLPVITTNSASGLLTTTVATPGCPPTFSIHDNSVVGFPFLPNPGASFSFMVSQQSFGTLGVITISNIHMITTADAPLGPVLVDVMGNNGGGAVAFETVVSNATIGTAPALTANAITASGTALGATKVGPFTITPTKLAKPGKYVTWKFSTGSALVGKAVQIWVATKNSAGKWSAFKLLTTRRVDTSGNAYFWWRTYSKAWISVRAGYLTTLSVATQARWL